MQNSCRNSQGDSTKSCAVCGNRFGLIRYYWWRTALCSKKCVARFKARRDADHSWLRLANRVAHADEHQAEFEGKHLEYHL